MVIGSSLSSGRYDNRSRVMPVIGVIMCFVATLCLLVGDTFAQRRSGGFGGGPPIYRPPPVYRPPPSQPVYRNPSPGVPSQRMPTQQPRISQPAPRPMPQQTPRTVTSRPDLKRLPSTIQTKSPVVAMPQFKGQVTKAGKPVVQYQGKNYQVPQKGVSALKPPSGGSGNFTRNNNCAGLTPPTYAQMSRMQIAAADSGGMNFTDAAGGILVQNLIAQGSNCTIKVSDLSAQRGKANQLSKARADRSAQTNLPHRGLALHEDPTGKLGHTIRDHVYPPPGQSASKGYAKSAATYLKEKFAERQLSNPKQEYHSIFTNRSRTERAIGTAIKEKDAEIRKFLQRSGKEPLVIVYPTKKTIGLSLKKGEDRYVRVRHVLIVLIKDQTMPDGYRIRTAYPIREEQSEEEV